MTARLAAAGCVAAGDEADDLLVAADGSSAALESMVARREGGEPLAWIVGWVEFCGLRVRVDSGVYVPRWQTEPLARRAASLLPARGVGVDLCTGAGAIAVVLQTARPSATVVATDLDAAAVACARGNGVDALVGDLDSPLPEALLRSVDVLTSVVPYVPTEALHLLPRDVLDHEPRSALDGGAGGLTLLSRVVSLAPRWLRSGGWLLLELGGDQASAVTDLMAGAGFVDIAVLGDDEGDDRGIEGRLGVKVEHGVP